MGVASCAKLTQPEYLWNNNVDFYIYLSFSFIFDFGVSAIDGSRETNNIHCEILMLWNDTSF